MADTVLLALASLATRTDDPDQALDRILHLIAEDIRVHRGSIFLLNPDSDLLEIGARLNLAPGEDEPFAPGKGFGGQAVFRGEAMLASEQLAVPLFSADGQAVGVIRLERAPGDIFQPAELDRLSRLGEEAGHTLQRLWQLAHLRDKARQLETLLGAGQALVSKLDEGALFAALTRDGQRLMQARACVLYLYDPASATVRFGGAAGVVRPSPDQWPLDSCLVAAPIRTGKAVAIPDVQAPEYFDLGDVPRNPPLRSALVTPFAYEGEVLGVLAVFFDRLRRFDNDGKRLCLALASLGAVALQNARLYGRVFRSEEALRKNERLTMLGLITAEIAHEIRNPLTVLKLLQGGLGVDFPEGDPRRTDVRIIGEKLDQLEAIVSRVLQFGRAPSRLHARCSLAEIVEDTLALMRLKLAQGKVQLHYHPPPNGAMVNGHKGELQQALLNLLLNAVDAMPQGGEIRLTGAVETAGAGPMATLDIADTGPGVPDALRGSLFDAFLSGRPDGTGLGLAIAKRLLASHHGDIALVTTGPGGTTFRMTLPLV